MGSESDIELVAVSCKFDFSERRNLPNKEVDPDRKLLNGFRGLAFPLTGSISVSSSSPTLLEIHKGLLPFSRRLFPTPPPPSSGFRSSFPSSHNISLLAWLFAHRSAILQCPTIPPFVVTYRPPPDLPAGKFLRNPGRPRLKAQCALSLDATPAG